MNAPDPSAPDPSAANPSAAALVALLAERGLRIVFAESCTAGLVSARMAEVPGVSQWMCGSAVVYREQTKCDWLQVPPPLIARHSAVSEAVTRQLAQHVLESTAEAHISGAVTGHLGPGAPPEQDGVVFVAFAVREGPTVAVVACRQFTLKAKERRLRQAEAAEIALQFVAAQCAQLGSPSVDS